MYNDGLKGGITKWGARYDNKPIEDRNNLEKIADYLMYNNMAAKAYQAALPANIRFAIGNKIFPRPITEKNFTPQELDTLRSFVKNYGTRNKYDKSGYLTYKKNVEEKNVDDFSMVYNPVLGKPTKRWTADADIYGSKMPGIQAYDMVHKNYLPDENIFKDNIPTMIKKSFTNPVANMQTAVGRFYPSVDKNKNIVIDDVYDFAPVSDNDDWSSKQYRTLHRIMENTPRTQMKINLGRPEDWR